MRGTPHGTIDSGQAAATGAPRGSSKIEVRVQDVGGINYYVDDAGNVYDPRDVVARSSRPRIVGHWEQGGDGRYSIPELGISDPVEITA
tara:strand:+ start:238 stop:504 length:267 start_codon:yes stop_codon:yes gene_type:complete